MKIKKLIFSLASLINVMFVPIFDVWGGLFPGRPDYSFLDALGFAADGEFDSWLVDLTLAAFIPAVLMLLSSFTNDGVLFKIFSALGALSVAGLLFMYASQNGMDYLFDFDYGNISIGTWIALTLFTASFFAVSARNKNGTAVAAEVERSAAAERKYCPKCGTQRAPETNFCKNCGFNFNSFRR